VARVPDSLAEREPVPTATEDGLVFAGVDPGEIGSIVDRLERAGVEYGALRWARPTLEDVYLELTSAWSPDRAGRGSIADVDPEADDLESGASGVDDAGSGTTAEDSPEGGDRR